MKQARRIVCLLRIRWRNYIIVEARPNANTSIVPCLLSYSGVELFEWILTLILTLVEWRHQWMNFIHWHGDRRPANCSHDWIFQTKRKICQRIQAIHCPSNITITTTSLLLLRVVSSIDRQPPYLRSSSQATRLFLIQVDKSYRTVYSPQERRNNKIECRNWNEREYRVSSDSS